MPILGNNQVKKDKDDGDLNASFPDLRPTSSRLNEGELSNLREGLLGGEDRTYTNGTVLSVEDSLLWIIWTDPSSGAKDKPRFELGLRFEDLKEAEQLNLLSDINTLISGCPKETLLRAPLSSRLLTGILENEQLSVLQVENISAAKDKLICEVKIDHIYLHNLVLDTCAIKLDSKVIEVEFVSIKGQSTINYHSSGGSWKKVTVGESGCEEGKETALTGDFGETTVDKFCELHCYSLYFNCRNGVFEDPQSLRGKRTSGITFNFGRVPPEWKELGFRSLSNEESSQLAEKVRKNQESQWN